MELSQLQVFYHVAKEGSFTEAARKLRISQPSLSKSVGLLEAREGVKLLIRTRRGVSLTPLGEKIFADCEKVFASIEDIRNKFRATNERCEGHLRFGASDHVANYLLPDVLAQMRSSYPAVIPSIHAGAPREVVEMLVRRRLEFGLAFTRIAEPRLKFTPLAEFDIIAVANPKILRKNLDLDFIGSIKRDYAKHPAEPFWDKVQMKNQSILTLESNSQELQKRLCLNGLGVAVLAKFMVDMELREGKLAVVPLAPLSKSTSAELFLVQLANHDLSLAAKKVLEIFRAVIKERARAK